ncbi:hypothetical protein DXC92_03250 [Clostridiales bacterium TF09-2AC]|nr:hypothetical protein DXC92_03250 [Clostridiales bacterium TF09-2AC]
MAADVMPESYMTDKSHGRGNDNQFPAHGFWILSHYRAASGRIQWHYNDISWKMDRMKHYETFEGDM